MATYQQGYVAGRRKGREDAVLLRRDQLWNEAFLVALGALINASGWTADGKPCSSVASRVELAVCTADEAINRMKGVE